MVQLWFNTNIAWVNKPTNVVAEAKKIAPAVQWAVQWINALNSAPKATQTIGRLKPKTSDDDNIVLAANDMIQQTKPADQIIQEYSTKMSPAIFDKTVNLVRDITNWSWLNELHTAYPDITKDVVTDVFTINDELNNPEDKPGIVKNFVSGVVSRIPKMFGNILKTVVEDPMTDPLYMPNQLLKRAWKDQIKLFGNEQTGKKTFWEAIQMLWAAAQREITDYIWGDSETIPYKAWEIATEIAPFFVVPWLWWEKLWAMGTQALTNTAISKFPALTKFITHPFIQKTLQKTITSLPSTEASTIMTEGRTANPEELAVWAVVQNLIPSKSINQTQKLTKNIWERVTDKNIRAWLPLGNTVPQRSWIKKWLFWSKDVVTPTQRSKDAVETIKNKIPKFSTEPTKLYSQVDDAVKSHSDDMSLKLKDVSTSVMTPEKQDMITKLEWAFIDAQDDLTPSVAKNVKKLLDNVKVSQNADEIWEINKTINANYSDKIKAWVNLTSKEQQVYRVWKESQDAVKKYLMNVGDSAWYKTVAEDFKVLSDLLHAKWQLKVNMPTLLKAGKWVIEKWANLTKEAFKLYLLGKALWLWGETKSWAASSE